MGLPKATTVSNMSHHGSLSLMSNHPHPTVHAMHQGAVLGPAQQASADTASSKKKPKPRKEAAEEAENADSKNPSSWDPQDDILLRHLKEVKKMGWKDISQYFQNRTPNACQFRWRRLKSGNLKSNKTAILNINEYNIDISSIPVSQTEKSSAKETKEKLTCKPAQQARTTKSPKNMQPGTHFDNVSPAIEISPSSNNVTENHGISPMYHNTLPQQQNHFTHTNTTAQNLNFDNINGTATKFAKPRSMSHTATRPSNFAQQHAYSTTTVNGHHAYQSNTTAASTELSPDEEKVGFVPKVFVRSRRSSFAHPTNNLIGQNMLSPPTILNNTSVTLSTVMNLALNGSKSRKNSFSTRSRRSSFNISSTTTSRRPSLVMAPNSATVAFGPSGVVSPNSNTVLSTPTSRRTSIAVPYHRQPSSGALGSVNGNFMDLPQHLKRSQNSSQPSPPALSIRGSFSSNTPDWNAENDKLLIEAVSKHLSFSDISNLLPNKSIQEIKWRMNVLSSENTPSSSAGSPYNPSDSPKKSLEQTDDSSTTPIDHNTFGEDDDEGESAINDSDSPDYHMLQRETSASSKEVSPNSVYSSSSVNANKLSGSINDVRSVSINASSISSLPPNSVNSQIPSNIKQLPNINNIVQDMV
ncbi:hypothetical protein TPHA_0A00990 [Tetrapisispora phaffii CBS 4417]|uniref:Myb-like domain-containing protein n=1 Tax=Tetrapisispora phaffii (strain ATCC 24235 / CBS 4417 / NBRC 1672 / NRRL Y-8282 / UCD 70-5) TaxID=1071381 RepID=G8BMQ6_TETPH|nr:hypothetical protein TPHA_0A00990 [Tetrapisispora phaffii CBS 4417]CCE61184.1 hypothetical protein TPHA_0A00990 [Tetrapisispora phaffii CBS 4417]